MEMCGKEYFSEISDACVPLPEPGAPNKTIFITLFQEAFIVFHHDLRFERLIEFKSHRNDDQKSRCAERHGKRGIDRTEHDRRNERNHRQINGAEKNDSVGNPLQIIGRRLTRSGAGDKSAVLLNALGNIFGLELYRIVKVREEQNQKAHHHDVEPAARSHIFGVPVVAGNAEQVDDEIGERQNREREDKRHNARRIHLDGNVRRLTAVHLSAFDLFCILYGNFSFRIVDRNDRRENEDRRDDESDERPEHELRFPSENRDDGIARRADDTREDEHGNTVGHAVIGDPFAQPHGQARARRIDDDENDIIEPNDAEQLIVFDIRLKTDQNTDRLRDGEKNRHVTRDRSDLFSALFALFGKSFKRGNTDGQKLYDNGRVDVRSDTHGKQRAVLQRAAADRAHDIQIQERIVAARREKTVRADPRNGDIATDPVYQENKEREENLTPYLFDFKCFY